jgi:hypothetical protein
MEKVSINYGKYKIELAPFEWRRIKRGEKNEYYKDKNERTIWEFNQFKKGSCRIETSNESIDIELKDCKIQFIETRPQLELKIFQELFTPFISFSTWTKEKHAAYSALRSYMNDSRHEFIISSRDNKTTKVQYVNHFTIFKVDKLQRGIMKPYRNQYVLMYMIDKHNFQRFLEIYPIQENITEKTLETVALNCNKYSIRRVLCRSLTF